MLVAPALSVVVMVRTALPDRSAVGVKVRVPSGAMAGATVKREGSSTVTAKVTVWAVSSAGPGVMPVIQPAPVWGPLSSATVTGAPVRNAGVSLTGVMVTL